MCLKLWTYFWYVAKIQLEDISNNTEFWDGMLLVSGALRKYKYFVPAATISAKAMRSASRFKLQ